MRKILLLALVVAVAGGAITLAFALTGGSEVPKPGIVRISGPVPPLTGPEIAGGRFSPRDYEGRPLVVNFWNPYCAPCRIEATVLDLAYGRLSHRVTMAGVLFSDNNFPYDVPAARRFARELGERYPTIDDPDHTIAHRFGVPGIPTTIVADARGRLRFAVYGPLKRGELEGLVRRVRR
jgi:cytochrome c biogenesis protein CcmG/thiol:disulfide interchange protein DsbE